MKTISSQNRYQDLINYYQSLNAAMIQQGTTPSISAQQKITSQEPPLSPHNMQIDNTPAFLEVINNTFKGFVSNYLKSWLSGTIFSSATTTAAGATTCSAGCAAGGAASCAGAGAATAGIAAAIMGTYITAKNGEAMRAAKGDDLNGSEACMAATAFKGEPLGALYQRSSTVRKMDPLTTHLAKFVSNKLFHVSTKEYQAERNEQLREALPSFKDYEAALSKQSDLFASQRNNNDGSVEGFGKEFIGYDPNTGHWINNAYAKTGDTTLLKAEDIKGSQLSFEMFGENVLSADPLEMRVAAEAMKNVGLESRYGMLYPAKGMNREEYATKVDNEILRLKSSPDEMLRIISDQKVSEAASTLQTILRDGQGDNPNTPQGLREILCNALTTNGQTIPNVQSDYATYVNNVLNGEVATGLPQNRSEEVLYFKQA